jgi:hypothetical protein
MTYLLSRLLDSEKLTKVGIERLTEPIHLNVASLFVAAFGSYRAKVAFDVVVRPQYAYSILRAADQAREYGISRLTITEFGVASGAGLLNMCRLAERTTKATGVRSASSASIPARACRRPLIIVTIPSNLARATIRWMSRDCARTCPAMRN